MQKNSDIISNENKRNKNDLNSSDILKKLIETLEKINLSHKSELGKKQVELFFNHMPIIFWNSESMKELLGPYSLAASIVAAKKFESYKKNMAEHKSYPALGLNNDTKNSCQGHECQKSEITSQPALEYMYDFLVPKKLKNSDLKTISDQEVAASLSQAIREDIITLDDIRNYFDACAERMTYMIELIIYEMIFSNLNLKHKTEKTNTRNMLSMENFEQKLKRAYFSELSDEQLSNGLYLAALRFNITLKDLRDYFNDDMDYVIGLTICKIVLENLDTMYESNGKRILAFFKDLGSWVTDYLFENYMERITKYHYDGDYGDLYDDYGFMFSYPADKRYKKLEEEKPDVLNWLKSVIDKALEGQKVENKIVEEYNIDPLHLAKYFSMLDSDKFDYDPNGFASLYYNYDKATGDFLMDSIDVSRYRYFYKSYLNNDKYIDYISKHNKDSLGVLFLVMLGQGAVYVDDEVLRCFSGFLKDLNPTPKKITGAFAHVFENDNNWMIEYSRCISNVIIYAINKFSERFFVPVVFAIMNKTVDITIMEDNLYSCFTGCDFCNDFGRENEQDFINDIYNMWGDSLYHPTKEEIVSSIVFDMEKVRLALESINRLDDEQKLISIISLLSHKFRKFRSNESRIISKEIMDSKLKKCFSLALENCKNKKDKVLDGVYMIYRIMRDREILGLKKNQLRYILEKALKFGAGDFEAYKDYGFTGQLKNKFDNLVKEIKKELESKTLENQDENIIDLDEDQKEKNKKENSDIPKKDLNLKLGGNKKPEPRQQDNFIGKKRNQSDKDI